MKCTLDLVDCPHLRTLEGVDRFLSANPGLEITITVWNCPSLAFDPYDYKENARFEFWCDVPGDVKLVKATALLASDQLAFHNIKDSTLNSILCKWRSRGPIGLLPLARELLAAGYAHHVRE